MAAIGALSLLAVLSTGWSVAPGTTLQSSIALAALTATGLSMAPRLGQQRLRSVLSRALLLVLVAAVTFEVIGLRAGGYSGATDPGWRGPLANPNLLAFAAILSLGLGVADRAQRRSMSRWVGMALAVFVVIKTRSTTGQNLAVFVPLLILGLRTLRGASARYRPVVLAAVGGAGWALLLPASRRVLSGLLGIEVNPNLSGRDVLWEASWRSMFERPFGHGFESLRAPSPEMASSIADAWRTVDVHSFQAHNGYLDAGVQLGWIGLGLAVCLVASIVTLHTHRYIRGRTDLGLVVVAWLLALYNLLESRLTAYALAWVIVVAISATSSTAPPLGRRRLPNNSQTLASPYHVRPAPTLDR